MLGSRITKDFQAISGCMLLQNCGEFEKITENYKKSVNSSVSSIVIHPDLKSRMDILKKFI